MKHFSVLKGLAVSVACCGLILPQPLLAGAQRPAAKPAPRAEATAPADIALTAGGTLTGQVVDGQGRGLDGAAVSLRQGDREIARTLSNRDGFFSVTNLRGGTYQVIAGQKVQMYRLWSPNTAPPSARSRALLVSAPQVVRGNGGGCGDMLCLAALGLGAAGTILGIIALSENSDQDDRIDQIPISP